MKHPFYKLLIVLFFAILSYSYSYSQKIKGALIFGTNICQVDGDEVYGFHKFGFNTGVSAIIPFGNNNQWDITLETLYNQKGAYQKPKFEPPETGEYKLKLNYAEVPVLIHYTDKGIITVGGGFSWGKLVKAKEWEHGNKTETNIDGPYKSTDFNILADLRFRLYKKFHFNLRYAYSLIKIRQRTYSPPDVNPWTRKQYNNLVSFRIIYIFNENPPIAKKHK